MSGVVDSFFEFGGDVGVNSGGRKRGVAEEHLDGFEVHAVFEPMSGNRVANGVGGDIFGKTALAQVFVKFTVD